MPVMAAQRHRGQLPIGDPDAQWVAATVELDARSRAAGWGISSNLAHPGISPTNLLAAQPAMGRHEDTDGYRQVQEMSRRGVAGTVDSAALSALMAATDPQAQGDQFFGPGGPGNLGGAPTLQELWPTLSNLDDARRPWEESERLVGMPSPA